MSESQKYTNNQGGVQQDNIEEEGDEGIDQTPVAFDESFAPIWVHGLLLLLTGYLL